MRVVLKTFLIAYLLFLTNNVLQAQSNWRKLKTVEDLCKAYPKVITKMIDQFQLDLPELEFVKNAYQKGKLTEAAQLLLAYYEKGNQLPHLRHNPPTESTKTIASADTILKNVFTVQNVKGKVPYGADGHRDWYYKGPNNDREWAWLSNRHSQINQVYDAYLETGNPKYIEYIDLFLRDFIIKSMPYPGVKSRNSVWRGLEVSFRAKVWTRLFYGLLKNEHFSPATHLLILSSLPDHAHYNRNFHGSNNWLTMEISALATVATHFPEYKQSKEWLAYSKQSMITSMEDQVYPDGVQTELTSHYHNVSLRNFEQFKDLCDLVQEPLPEKYHHTLELMYQYIAHAVRPDGNRILNNDGDLGSDKHLILKGSEQFNHPEWNYIITNGVEGKQPSGNPSYFFPWAGHLISRSGYDADAHWSFFDVGPWGSGHQHNDKLHLSIAAYGRDLLVDSGRFAYTGEVAKKFRGYAKSSAGHNVILIDGKGQSAGYKLATAAVSDSIFRLSPNFDFATGTFDQFKQLAGKALHQRAMMYVRDEFWVVVDRIETDQPRRVDALWHWHPSCNIVQEDQVTRTNNEKGNLTIIPVGSSSFEIQSVKGQETPTLQGWYSQEYNIFEPNTTTIYQTTIEKTSNLVWILAPYKSKSPEIKAKIIEENDQQLLIRINYNNSQWELNIPFKNSHQAKLIKNK